MEFSITAANLKGGGPTLASFGSGESEGSGGRLQVRARGVARNQNASPAEVRAVRAAIRRAGATGRSAAARRRRALLDQIDLNARGRARNVRRGVLADIRAALDEL